MPINKSRSSPPKPSLHPRNKHSGRYNFKLLIKANPELARFVVVNKYDNETIDFFNPDAVKALNKSLLIHYYKLKFWDVPNGYLCPPIPGRADYIHHIADVLGGCNSGEIPTGSKIKCLDIGVGANCVYPVIGHSEYGWSFVGSDIDSVAIASANKIIASNEGLKKHIQCRLQHSTLRMFDSIIRDNEHFDLTICNPPFHASMAEANASNIKKLSNLKNKKIEKAELNFGGKVGELWTKGGEKGFILNMIRESKEFSKSCFWFSTLVSKKENLEFISGELEKIEVADYKVIPMGQGNKVSRIIVWTFLTPNEQNVWRKERWLN